MQKSRKHRKKENKLFPFPEEGRFTGFKPGETPHIVRKKTINQKGAFGSCKNR